MTASLPLLSRGFLASLLALGGGLLLGGGAAGAAEAPVGLGTATSFAVLGATTVTNTGPSVISGDLGVSPGTAVTGFPPGTVLNGVIHAGNAEAAQAQADVTTAYNDAAGRSVTANVTADLAGQTLVSGVYRGATLGLTGTVTLDAQGDPNAVFIFQAGSTLITEPGSRVSLVNGADACNVYWQVGSSATLGTTTDFVGTVIALASVGAQTGATVNGRLFARNGAVTLDSNTITRGGCAAIAPGTPPTTLPTTTTLPLTSITTLPGTAGTAGTGGTGSTGTVGATPGTGRATDRATATATSRARPTPGPGDSSTATGRSTPLANTGSQLTATSIAAALTIMLGAMMLVASRTTPSQAPRHRRRR